MTKKKGKTFAKAFPAAAAWILSLSEFECNVCGKKFSKIGIKAHMESHYPKP